MTYSDQEIIKRFPVGYYRLHPNVSLNFQMNRFWGRKCRVRDRAQQQVPGVRDQKAPSSTKGHPK